MAIVFKSTGNGTYESQDGDFKVVSFRSGPNKKWIAFHTKEKNTDGTPSMIARAWSFATLKTTLADWVADRKSGCTKHPSAYGVI